MLKLVSIILIAADINEYGSNTSIRGPIKRRLMFNPRAAEYSASTHRSQVGQSERIRMEQQHELQLRRSVQSSKARETNQMDSRASAQHRARSEATRRQVQTRSEATNRQVQTRSEATSRQVQTHSEATNRQAPKHEATRFNERERTLEAERKHASSIETSWDGKILHEETAFIDLTQYFNRDKTLIFFDETADLHSLFSSFDKMNVLVYRQRPITTPRELVEAVDSLLTVQRGMEELQMQSYKIFKTTKNLKDVAPPKMKLKFTDDVTQKKVKEMRKYSEELLSFQERVQKFTAMPYNPRTRMGFLEALGEYRTFEAQLQAEFINKINYEVNSASKIKNGLEPLALEQRLKRYDPEYLATKRLKRQEINRRRWENRKRMNRDVEAFPNKNYNIFETGVGGVGQSRLLPSTWQWAPNGVPFRPKKPKEPELIDSVLNADR